MLENNIELQNITGVYLWNYGDCAHSSFEMSVGVTEDILPNSSINIAFNGRHVIPARFSGLPDLKYHLDFLDPCCIYFPGHLEQERSYHRPSRDESFYYPKNETGIIVFEVCGFDGSYLDLWRNLEIVDPSLGDVGFIAVPVFVNGKNGWRFYALVEDGNSISRYGPLFSMRSWIHGLSGVHQVEPEKYAIREYVNAEAFNPGYLMSGGSVRGPIEIQPGNLLNTQSYPYLSQSEKTMLVNNCAQAISRCPLSKEAANVDRLTVALWYGAHHDGLVPFRGSRKFPPTNSEERREIVNTCAKFVAWHPLSNEAANVDKLARAIWRGASHDAQERGDQYEE